jgi:hypothetical protein
MIEFELTNDQRNAVMLQEIDYQLTTMKQYLTPEELDAYLLILERYGTLIQREYILKRYTMAWG